VSIFDPIYSKRRITFFLSGGVVGGAILNILLVSAFWFVRRRPSLAVSQERPVNVLQDDEDRREDDHWYDLPQSYTPEPLLVPDQTTASGTPEPASTPDRSLSRSTVTANVQRPQIPTTPTTMIRKSTSFPQLRPDHIIQHDDAGPSKDLSGQAEPETTELPPAYSDIGQPQRSLLLPLQPATAAENE
jgi:hypothetical protein